MTEPAEDLAARFESALKTYLNACKERGEVLRTGDIFEDLLLLFDENIKVVCDESYAGYYQTDSSVRNFKQDSGRNGQIYKMFKLFLGRDIADETYHSPAFKLTTNPQNRNKFKEVTLSKSKSADLVRVVTGPSSRGSSRPGHARSHGAELNFDAALRKYRSECDPLPPNFFELPHDAPINQEYREKFKRFLLNFFDENIKLECDASYAKFYQDHCGVQEFKTDSDNSYKLFMKLLRSPRPRLQLNTNGKFGKFKHVIFSAPFFDSDSDLNNIVIITPTNSSRRQAATDFGSKSIDFRLANHTNVAVLVNDMCDALVRKEYSEGMNYVEKINLSERTGDSTADEKLVTLTGDVISINAVSTSTGDGAGTDNGGRNGSGNGNQNPDADSCCCPDSSGSASCYCCTCALARCQINQGWG